MIVGNEEPQYTEIANVQIASTSHKLPEQSRLPPCSIPRPFGFEHLIHQWQPMGIRVVLNLPFTGNDYEYLFAIRNGPFIPTLFHNWQDTSVAADKATSGPTAPDLKTRKLTTLDTYQSYAFNNMINVRHAYYKPRVVDPGQNAITITQYDQPPILAALSTMFRKWRGTMHYRIRVVAGFTTQGYIFASLVRNSNPVIGIFPTQNHVTGIQLEDESYRPSMLNSYVMGDTAMFRHFEVEVPFEYPVPFYDQFNWIGNRSRPADLFAMYHDPDTNVNYFKRFRSIRNEPHGDNYVLFGLRGNLLSSTPTSQISFEIEYRAGDDFQFADPFLPFDDHYLKSYAQTRLQSQVPIVSIPSSAYTTDGLHSLTKVESSSDRRLQMSRQLRRPRDTYGYDEVDNDDLKSEVGDAPDVLDLKRNLRKSLNM